MTALLRLSAPTVSHDLLAFLRQQHPHLAGASSASPLADLGIDSFTLMELILFVERTYQTEVPLDRLTPEAAASVETLAKLVVELAGPT